MASLVSNNIAAAGSQFWRILQQLISPPLLISAWGIEGYGSWLLLTTVPTFLSMADIGFSDASAADMAMQLAKGNKVKANQTYSASFSIAFSLFVFIILSSLPILFVSSVTIGSVLFEKEDITALWLLTLYSAFAVFTKFQLGVLRAGSRYALSTVGYDFIQFLEGLSVVLTASIGYSIVVCCFVFVLTRFINSVFLFILQRKYMPFLKIDLSKNIIYEARRLAIPAAAAFSIPLLLVSNLQISAWIMGAFGGAASAAILVTVRTASRVVVQAVGIFSRAAAPIYSYAIASENTRKKDQIEKINRNIIWAILFPGCITFAIFGSKLISVWTHGQIVPAPAIVAVLSLASFLHAIWYYRANLLVATNRHVRLSAALVPITGFGLIIAVPLTYYFSLLGCSLSILITEFLTLFAYMKLLRSH